MRNTCCDIRQQNHSKMSQVEARNGDLKELLLRSEADRVRLQQQLAATEQQRLHEASAKEQLQLDLDKALAGWEASRQDGQQAHAAAAAAHNDMLAAVREYRANEIIAVGLRDVVSSLQEQLRQSQAAHKEVAEKYAFLNKSYASDVGDMASSLKHRIDELLEQHKELTQQRDEGLAEIEHLSVELARTVTDSEARERRLADDKAVLAKQVGDLLAEREKLVQQIEELKQDRDEKAHQLTLVTARIRELESEVTGVREGLMVLSKTVQLQGCPHVPSTGDEVWTVMGPLGGVQYMLELLHKHVRLQDSKTNAAGSEAERIKERLLLEGKRLMELQEQTFEVRNLYERAVKDRVDLERRAHSAEAERLLMEQALSKARMQILDDEAKLKECHDSMGAMAQKVAELTPLTARVGALLTENGSLMEQLERLQAQHDLLQKILHGKGASEERWASMAESMQQEHQRFVEANRKLLEQLDASSKRTQELELQVRESSLLRDQLEATRSRLALAESRLLTVTESHGDTVKKLETAKMFLSGLERGGSGDGAGGSPRRSSLNRSSVDGEAAARLQASPRRHTAVGVPSPLASPRQQQQQQQRPQSASVQQPGVGLDLSPRRLQMSSGQRVSVSPRLARWQADSVSEDGVASTSDAGDIADVVDMRSGRAASLAAESTISRTPSERHFLEAFAAGPSEEAVQSYASSLPPDVAALLAETGLADELARKQKRWHDVKLGMLSYFSNQLRAKLAQQRQAGAYLELELLRKDAEHTEQLMSREQEVAKQVMAAMMEAVSDLKQGMAAVEQLRELARWKEGELHPPTPAAGPSGGSGRRTSSSGSNASVVQRDEAGSVAGVLAVCASSSGAGAAVRPGSAAELAWKIAGSLRQRLKTEREHQESVAAAVAARREVGCQASSALQDSWLQFLRTLATVQTPKHALNHKAVAEAIVRVCLRAAGALEAREGVQLTGSYEQPPGSCEPPGGSGRGTPAGGRTSVTAGSGDSGLVTVADALRAHYSAQSDTPDAFDESLMTDPDGAVGRLLLSCRPLAQTGDVKAGMFHAFVTAVEEDGPWGTGAWAYYLTLLLGLKQLLLGAWRATTREWATPAGAKLPLQCVMDLLGNCYNLQDPGQVGRCLPALQELVSPSQSVDMDQLLQLLMEEHRAGKLPRHSLLHPRRLTDGVMGNMLNARGATPLSHSSTGAAREYMSPSGDSALGDSRPTSGTSTRSNASTRWQAGVAGLLPLLERTSEGGAQFSRSTSIVDSTSGTTALPPVTGRPDSPSKHQQLPSPLSSSTGVAAATSFGGMRGSAAVLSLDKRALSLRREGSGLSPLSSPSVNAQQRRQQQQQQLEGW